ncbi:nicotinate phosphoribosyltransferase [Flammeovirgaceae bacterium SG7u.111]|nr:nicotinate phosphoribosyltransferase [Flammeovirgaceae bacterium SG7u.132]WPO34696.1 nicotinate phosphoribosyltransferase [Flammeovirgaceae bacterium SG7u.111]
MKLTQDLYRSSLALFTDFYQLTMTYGYWKTGMTDKEASFNLYFRNNPFKGGFTIACGLEYVIDYLESFKFEPSDLEYLATIEGNDGKKLFEKEFLDFLADLKFECDIDAMPEGTVAFPYEPLIRITGPLYQCQLLETPLLNIVNFQSLIATKASRLHQAAKGEPVLEFGMRRAQGIDGALAASRAAYIGGASSTSNVLAGKLFNIPVKGTHAHSWVMSFDSEMEAFDAYAKAMPNNCVFLVDTYNTLEGVKIAIEAGKKLRQQGYEMTGIRLDSGDLAYLSIEARKMLDEAGFEKAVIVASNDLDENIITSLKAQQDAKVNVWGVGTKLATAYDQPALGGVYKVSAVRKGEGWDYKIKLSEQSTKTSNPGIQQVKRFYINGQANADMIYNEAEPLPTKKVSIVDPLDSTRRKKIKLDEIESKDLLVPIFKKGKLVYDLPKIAEIKNTVQEELSTFHSSIRRFSNPHSYPVGLEKGLYKLRTSLALKLRGDDE